MKSKAKIKQVFQTHTKSNLLSPLHTKVNLFIQCMQKVIGIALQGGVSPYMKFRFMHRFVRESSRYCHAMYLQPLQTLLYICVFPIHILYTFLFLTAHERFFCKNAQKYQTENRFAITILLSPPLEHPFLIKIPRGVTL